jgi:hypothetical protein
MASEEDVGSANKLLEDWKQQVSATFPEGAVIRHHLEQALSEASERVAKVSGAGISNRRYGRFSHEGCVVPVCKCLPQIEQAIQLRKQIDQLPAGTVKQHMSKALTQLEREIGMTVTSTQQGGSSSAMDTGSATLKVVVLKGGAQQTFEFKVRPAIQAEPVQRSYPLVWPVYLVYLRDCASCPYLER